MLRVKCTISLDVVLAKDLVDQRLQYCVLSKVMFYVEFFAGPESNCEVL